MNYMSWKTRCTELFSQYKELLTEFTHGLEFRATLNTLEQSVEFKKYDELDYWRNLAEVGYRSDMKNVNFD